MTSKTNEFSECFNNDQPILKQAQKWRQVLKLHCQKAFKKVRINRKKIGKPLKPEILKLIDQRNILLKENKHPEKKAKLEDIELKISDMEAAENREQILHNFKKFSNNPENVNLNEVWKRLKTIGPKHGSSMPTAKRNFKGKMISEQNGIKKLLAQ